MSQVVTVRLPEETAEAVRRIAQKERRVDVGQWTGMHGIAAMDGKAVFASESARLVAAYDPATGKFRAGSLLAGGTTRQIAATWWPELSGEAFAGGGAEFVRLPGDGLTNGGRGGRRADKEGEQFVGALAGGAGVDHSFEAVGNRNLVRQAVEVLAIRGTATIVGRIRFEE